MHLTNTTNVHFQEATSYEEITSFVKFEHF